VAEVDGQPPASGTRLAGGHLLAAISTSVVGILREHYGRGPMKAKTYALDDIIVVVMRGSGFTPLEQTIMDSGEPARVIAMREDFQRVWRSATSRRSKRSPVARCSRSQPSARRARHHDGDLLRRRPLEGFGAVEITAPEQSDHALQAHSAARCG
jgi:hypothetical protein